MMNVGIFPASGSLGTSTYTHLLSQVTNNAVVLISRFPEKVPRDYVAKGVRTRRASYESTPEELANAFSGLEALFLISYPSHVHEYRTQVQRKAIDAALGAGVKHIFYSSLCFAQNDQDTSVAEVMGAHLDTERYLKTLPGSATWTIVREGLYSESFPIYTAYWDIGNPSSEILIPHDGSKPGVSWVKRDELGEATARLVAQYASSPTSFAYTNKTLSLTGSREMTLESTVQTLSRAVGKEVCIRQVSVEEYATQPQVVEAFGSEALAKTWATAFEAIRRGETAKVTPILKKLLGRDPEDFEVTVRKLRSHDA